MLELQLNWPEPVMYLYMSHFLFSDKLFKFITHPQALTMSPLKRFQNAVASQIVVVFTATYPLIRPPLKVIAACPDKSLIS